MRNLTIWLGVFSDLKTDPRPLKANTSLHNSGFRTMELLDKHGGVVSVSKISSWVQMLFWGSVFRVGLARDRAIRNFLSARMRNRIVLNEPSSVNEVILLFDIDILPFVLHKFPLNPIVIDFREIYTEQFGLDVKFRLFLRPIRKYIIEQNAKKIKACYTVSRGLVSFYESEFGLKPTLIRSMPQWQSSTSSNNPEPNIKIVYLGVAHPLRNLEKSIRLITQARSDIEVHLYLVGDKKYIEALMRQYKGLPQIFFHPAVDFDKINETLSKFDLGWCYFTPETENLRNALPNKFYDYIQAGLGVVCGPNMDMIEEDRKWGFGFFTEDYSDQALIQLLANLTPDSILNAKVKSKLAKSELTWENEEKEFLQLIEKVMER
jgi:hypothetical protein